MDVSEGVRPPAGTITIDRDGDDRSVLCLRGDVDTAVATRFRSSQGRERVVVDAIDAQGVTFICSSALALMLLSLEASSRPAGTRCCARLPTRSTGRCSWQEWRPSSRDRNRVHLRLRTERRRSHPRGWSPSAGAPLEPR